MQMKDRFERRGLLLQAINQFSSGAMRQPGNIVNRFIGIKRHALTADIGQDVNHMGLYFLQAELKYLKQADRTGTDDQSIGFNRRRR